MSNERVWENKWISVSRWDVIMIYIWDVKLCIFKNVTSHLIYIQDVNPYCNSDCHNNLMCYTTGIINLLWLEIGSINPPWLMLKWFWLYLKPPAVPHWFQTQRRRTAPPASANYSKQIADQHWKCGEVNAVLCSQSRWCIVVKVS